MSICGIPEDEKTSPLGQGGTSGGFERGNKATPALCDRCRCATAWSLLKTPPSRYPSQEGIFRRVMPCVNCHVSRM